MAEGRAKKECGGGEKDGEGREMLRGQVGRVGGRTVREVIGGKVSDGKMEEREGGGSEIRE